jgi:hypothetical protein
MLDGDTSTQLCEGTTSLFPPGGSTHRVSVQMGVRTGQKQEISQ